MILRPNVVPVKALWVQRIELLEYKTLKELMSQRESNVAKEIRQDQLSVVKDSNNNDIVLGQGSFGVCKLMSLSVIFIS